MTNPNPAPAELWTFLRGSYAKATHGRGFDEHWTIHMHPATWFALRRDAQFFQYVNGNSGPSSLVGHSIESFTDIPVCTDPTMPIGAAELRFTDRLTFSRPDERVGGR